MWRERERENVLPRLGGCLGPRAQFAGDSEDASTIIRKGGVIRSETLIELEFLDSSFSSYPVIEIRQTAPCRAIRGNSISVNSTLQ